MPRSLDTSLEALPHVVLVGRMNVGKSTLFNRLTGERRALISPLPGTTRDRRTGFVAWRTTTFSLIDTGGVEIPQPEQHRRGQRVSSAAPAIERLVVEQTEVALNNANLIVLVVSTTEGVLPQDRTWAKHLRGKPHVLLVVNKVDNYRRAATVPDFFSLGLGAPFAVSAANGRGSGDLLDAIVDRLADLPPKKVTANQTMEPLTLAILGQPNSGKSTLMNAILGEHRMITSAVPHTTREPIDVLFTYRGQPLLLIDTAGIRRKAHVTRGVEASGVKASLQTVDRADVILLVIDLMRGVSRQDQRLASYMAEHRKGLVIVANKWDLVADKKPETMQALEHGLRRALPGCNWAPIVFTSALTQHRVPQTIEAALGAHTSGALSLSEGTLQQFLKTVTKHHLPMKGGGVRHPKILSFKQVAANPPQFEIVVRGELHPAYVKFLEHRLRQHFGFTGAPITITLKTKRRRIIK